MNGVIALILRFLPNSIALQADYVTVVENRSIMSVKYCVFFLHVFSFLWFYDFMVPCGLI